MDSFYLKNLKENIFDKICSYQIKKHLTNLLFTPDFIPLAERSISANWHICIEDFLPSDKIIFCSQKHGYHLNCIQDWMLQKCDYQEVIPSQYKVCCLCKESLCNLSFTYQQIANT